MSTLLTGRRWLVRSQDAAISLIVQKDDLVTILAVRRVDQHTVLSEFR